jgi:hypothetical protein
MLIVKTLIIGNMNGRQIYIKMERGGREQNAGETEKERVCGRGRIVAKLR